jgi:hypothetical protein
VLWNGVRWQTAAGFAAWAGLTSAPAQDGAFFLLELDGAEYTVDIEGVMCSTLMPKNELTRRLDATEAPE